eukprot:813937-Amphidinium_carterae.1
MPKHADGVQLINAAPRYTKESTVAGCCPRRVEGREVEDQQLIFAVKQVPAPCCSTGIWAWVQWLTKAPSSTGSCCTAIRTPAT